MEVIEVEINQLKPAEYNPRAMTEKEAVDLDRSITEFGMVEPIVVNKAKGRENVIVGGHQRYNILKLLGWETIPVVYVDIPELAKEQELNIRLNKNLGHWDFDMLANFDEEILKMAGWDEKELDDIFKHQSREDEPPPVSEGLALSTLGEVYQLGRHRLMCGDSTKIEDVEKLMNGQKADMVFTDPPYNVAYQGNNWSSGHIKSGKPDWEGGIENDKQSAGEFREFLLKAYKSLDIALLEGGAIYICYPSGKEGWDFIYAFDELGWHFQSTLVWKKGHLLISRWDYHPIYEPILYGWKGKNHNFYGQRNQSNVLEHDSAIRQNEAGMHPTQKPISLIVQFIKNNTQSENNSVLDLFGGSGFTLIACEQTNRTCYMMELDPKYCDVIRKRYAKFIGKEEEWQTITPKM